MKPAHLRAQAALVRMLYDPTFSEAVRAAPRVVLGSLPHALADQLGALNPRALRRDAARRQRTVDLLREELPASCALAALESAELLDFYASAFFHQAVEEGQPFVLALGAWLESQVADGALRSPVLITALAIELTAARARRGGERRRGDGTRLCRAAGVEPAEVAEGGLAAWHAARAGEPLPPLGQGREPVCAIVIDGEVSVVAIERPLYAVLVSAAAPRTRTAIVEEAALRLGDRAAAERALESLVEDDLIVTS